MIKRGKIGMLFLRYGFLWMLLLVLAGPLMAQLELCCGLSISVFR